MQVCPSLKYRVHILFILGTVDSYPIIPGPPDVTNAVLSSSVRFDCQLQEAEAGSIYYVTWTTGSTTLRNVTLAGGDLLDSFDTSGLSEGLRQSIISNGVCMLSWLIQQCSEITVSCSFSPSSSSSLPFSSTSSSFVYRVGICYSYLCISMCFL